VKHVINSRLLTNTVKVALVGCGGVGSQFLTGLARLHTALIALGHPGGFEVEVYDPDTVSESNVGRQLFSPADVGINKATLLVHRLNAFFGLKWKAKPQRFPVAGDYHTPHIIISCVDTKAARRDIAEYVAKHSICYWLDTGNNLADGQIILGQSGYGRRRTKGNQQLILPTVTDLYPAILDKTAPEDEDAPSCSLAEALERQDLFIGQSIATFGLQLLWSLFRNGGLEHHGYFVNLKAGRVAPLPVDPEAWKRFVPKKKRPSRKKKATPSETNTSDRMEL
jgi:PRTRC genetic system ThiF family protein